MESENHSTELRVAISKFLEYCDNYRNLSPYTLRNYKSDLDDFLNYLISESKTKINDMDRSVVRKYINLLNNLNYKRSSINRKLSVVRVFFKYISKLKVKMQTMRLRCFVIAPQTFFLSCRRNQRTDFLF